MDTIGTFVRLRRIHLFLFSALWFLALSLFVFLTKYPTVFGDEAGYYLPMIFGWQTENYQAWQGLMQYPAYLYFFIGSAFPADHVYTLIRATDAAFVALTIFPACLVGKQYLTRNRAIIFACVVVTSPISTFVRYVMPETLYLFGFWTCIATFLILLNRSALLAAIALGVSCALLSLLKPHAVSLVIGTVGYFLIRDATKFWFAAVALIVAFLLGRFAFGVAFVGHPILGLAEGSYSSMTSAHIDWGATLKNSIGHAVAISVLVGPLVVGALWSAISSDDTKTSELSLIAICLLSSMAAMTIYFSQSVYQIAPESEAIERLHGRYYTFALPLFLLFGLRMLGNTTPPPKTLLLVPFAFAPVASAILYLFYYPGQIDFPDITFWGRPRLVITIILLQVMILLWVARGFQDRVWFAASVTFIAIEVVTTAGIAGWNSVNKIALPIDQAFTDNTTLTSKLIGQNNGVVLGSALDVPRALFYLRSLSSGRVSAKFVVTDQDVRTDRWTLLLPGYSYTGIYPSFSEYGLTLIRPDGVQ